MEGFDANVANGVADIGELQNGKGDFLNDLLALILDWGSMPNAECRRWRL